MKSFSILGGKVHVVELPESDNTFRNLGVSIKSEIDNKVSGKLHSRGKNGWESVNLPPGPWQMVGLLPEVTEEQADELVEWVETGQYYVDYRVDGWWNGDITALESLESAILAEGYTFLPPEYPDISDPKFYDEPYDGTGFYQEIYSGAIEDYHKSQSRVLSRERCLLLRREDV